MKEVKPFFTYFYLNAETIKIISHP